MQANKLRQLKPSYENLQIIGRVTYEATGNEYWIHLRMYAGQSLAMGIKFFEIFYLMRDRALKILSEIDVFKYNLVKLDRTKVPFLYNRL